MINGEEKLTKFIRTHFPFFASADMQDEIWREDKINPANICEEWIWHFTHDWKKIRDHLPPSARFNGIAAFYDEVRQFFEKRFPEIRNPSVVRTHRNVLYDQAWQNIQRHAQRIARSENVPFYSRMPM